MSKKWMLIAIFAILSAEFYAQRSTIELTFTAVNVTEHVRLHLGWI